MSSPHPNKDSRTRRCWTTDGAALFAERRVACESFLLSSLPLAPSVPELKRSGSPMRHPLSKSRGAVLTADSADITDRDTPLQLGRAASVSASSVLSAVLLLRPGLSWLLPINCVASQPGCVIPEQGAPENRRPRLRSESPGDWLPTRRDRRSGSAAVPGLGRSAPTILSLWE